MKLIGLKIDNFKRIEAMELVFDPKKNFVVLGGRNEQGKSSTLDALETVLRGKKAMPPKPVREGARKSKLAAELDNGDRIKRTIDASTGRDTIVVKDKNGETVGRPQTYLDGMLGPIFFDPEEFSRMDEKGQNETLRKLIGLDTSKLDQERGKLYTERTEENREVRRLRTLVNEAPLHEGVEAVDVAALADELELLQQQVTNNQADRDEATRLGGVVDEVQSALAEANRIVERLTGELEQAKRDQNATGEHWDKSNEAAEKARVLADALVDPDLDETREKLRGAEATNTKVRENEARVELVKKLSMAEGNSEVLTEDLAEIDAEIAALIANAKMPIEGLGFDGDIVTYQGLPFKEQASQSARCKVSAYIGVAMNPGIRVLLIRSGSFCDAESFAALKEVADKTDTLMLVEMVTRNEADEAYCTYVIENGAVRAAEEPAS